MAARAEFLPELLCGVPAETQQKLWGEQQWNVVMNHSEGFGFTDLPEKGCCGALALYFGSQVIKQNCNTFSCGTWSQNRIWAL